MTLEELDAKLDRAIGIVTKVANHVNELDAKVTLALGELDGSADQHTSLKVMVRDVRAAVDDLTKIARFHDARIRDAEKTIHELQADERRAVAASSER